MMRQMETKVNYVWINLWESVWKHKNFTYTEFQENEWTED